MLILFVVSNVFSYLRKPELFSTSLPALKVKLLDGSSYQTLKGKPLVLHFWAEWCPICRLEASNIQSISQRYEVLTVMVSSGNDEKVQAYMKANNLSFRVLNDSNGIWAKKFKVEAFPTTFVYDSKGELRFTEVGYTTTVGLLARLKLIE